MIWKINTNIWHQTSSHSCTRLIFLRLLSSYAILRVDCFSLHVWKVGFSFFEAFWIQKLYFCGWSMCICYQSNSKINYIAETQNVAFIAYVNTIYIFYEDQTNCLGIGTQKRASIHILKMCTFWKIENISTSINITHFPEKRKPPSNTWVDFHQLKLASLHACKVWYLKWKVRMV